MAACVVTVLVATFGSTDVAEPTSVAAGDGRAGARHGSGEVMVWNQHAVDALIGTAGQSPTVSSIHMAIVHGAVYDAVNAIDRTGPPYLVMPDARRWYSTGAAAATAAHRVLLALVPSQAPSLDAHYATSIDAIRSGPARDGGVRVGEEAAAAMLAARADDGRFGPFRFAVGTGPGQWRPTPPAFINDPNAWVARVTPFLIDDPARFRTRGPDPLTSRRYARDFAEVRDLGSIDSTVRTADQTDASRFWSENAVVTWTGITRTLVDQRHLDDGDSARLLAQAYLGGADAVIACWDDKAHWGFWRPVTAIHEAASDGNPATAPVAGWQPLLVTPPYPDHPSGHNCLSASFVHTLVDFFGTNRVQLSATSSVSGTTRTYARLTDVLHEIIDARVWSGLHFRTADVQAAQLGWRVAAVSADRFEPRR